ncbi:transcriptional regulator [Caproiciproducens sp. NJN-50]|uniref:helix-turn-helix transcriptional regulator n=1 Tax=Acutalibacteraceae TaxID=3082771 RepID=UPI000FFE0346|nr:MULTISPECIES: PAS domain-containing protein [Acutalibacteraceae]QAT48687.1 transcriptional regulator [Caproiciproducens sp. NJN-50]
MTSDVIRRYTLLVEFLGHMLGPDYEIALHDLSCKQPSIVAIANGSISGRGIGAPLTNVAMQLIAEKAYLTQDWKLNYRGLSANGKVLRCSTLFIKDERGALVGLLCINFDDSRYRDLSEKVFSLCHPDDYASKNIAISATESVEHETFYDNISSAMEDAFLAVTSNANIPTDRLNQEEKLEIIKLLDKKGVFMLKGAIPVVAKHLSCSQASIYRYLSKINQEKHSDEGPAE